MRRDRRFFEQADRARPWYQPPDGGNTPREHDGTYWREQYVERGSHWPRGRSWRGVIVGPDMNARGRHHDRWLGVYVRYSATEHRRSQVRLSSRYISRNKERV